MRGGAPDFSFAVFEQSAEGGYQVVLRHFRSDGRLEVGELLRHHVAHAPRLVLGAAPPYGHHQRLRLLFRQQDGDGHAGVHGQQTDRILIAESDGGGY